MKKNAVFILADRFDDVIFEPATMNRIQHLLAAPPTTLRPSELDSPEAASALASAQLIFSTWGAPKMNSEFLNRCPNLEAIFYGAGSVKNLATADLWERGVVLCSAWRANAIPVSEFSLGAILLSLKNVWPYHLLQREKKWSSSLPMPGAYHSTVGLVSLGAIGRRVAEMLRPFDIHVVAYDPHLAPETASELGIESVPLDELFRRADVISLHIPWLPETEKMINRELLASMKPWATLINTARGAVIDENDLIEVLGERTDLTAMLDVTHPEPPVQESPLWTLPNVLMTPHVAGSMPGEWARMGEYMVDECLRFCSGQPLQHEVRPEMLERMA
jgi:phosphoglycerate dehydrogenase-like enzyme